MTVPNVHPHNLVERFLEGMAAEKGASSNTLSSYKADIQDYFGFLEKQSPLTATNDTMLAYLETLQKKGFKTTTLARRVSSLKQFYGFLAEDGLCASNPTSQLSATKIKRPLPKTVTEVQIEILLQSVYQDETVEGVRMAALLETLYASGLRVSELVGLPLRSLMVDRDRKTLQNMVHVLGKGGKERLVPLNPPAVIALQNYLAIREQFVTKKNLRAQSWLFPSSSKDGHLTRQRFGQLLKQRALVANLDPDTFSPHILRHAFATHMLRGGADLLVIQKLLGHADIATTQIYTHVIPDTILDMVTTHHPLTKERNL
ncbi:MAG: site-specific tyrosine recombinase XerD [Alphaproteobacteria bacterium]|nr:site-specific tyrosine recombinase XerD [Alphaproteobacteria bacterium]